MTPQTPYTIEPVRQDRIDAFQDWRFGISVHCNVTVDGVEYPQWVSRTDTPQV